MQNAINVMLEWFKQNGLKADPSAATSGSTMSRSLCMFVSLLVITAASITGTLLWAKNNPQYIGECRLKPCTNGGSCTLPDGLLGPYFCVNPCRSDTVFYEPHNSCLSVDVEDSATWQAATDQCSASYPGGRLYVATTRADIDHIKTYGQAARVYVNAKNSYGVFVRLDTQEPLDVSLFVTDEPDGSGTYATAGYVSSVGEWGLADYGGPLESICEYFL